MALQFRIALLLLLGTLPALVMGTGIYTWKDARGHTHFGDRPPRDGQARALDPQINIISRPDSPVTGPASGERQVVIYTAEWCGICRRAKAYFRKKGVPYREYDVEKSAKGRRDYQRLHGKGVPIILVGDQRLDGFSPDGFEALYHPR